MRAVGDVLVGGGDGESAAAEATGGDDSPSAAVAHEPRGREGVMGV